MLQIAERIIQEKTLELRDLATEDVKALRATDCPAPPAVVRTDDRAAAKSDPDGTATLSQRSRRLPGLSIRLTKLGQTRSLTFCGFFLCALMLAVSGLSTLIEWRPVDGVRPADAPSPVAGPAGSGTGEGSSDAGTFASQAQAESLAHTDGAAAGKSVLTQTGQRKMGRTGGQELISFTDDPNEIMPVNLDFLFQIADQLIQIPEATLTLSGYCDVVGGNETNLNLSRFQTQMVKSYLIGRGILPDKIRTLALGDTSPMMIDRSNKASSADLPKRYVMIEWADCGGSQPLK
jgi:outer membrane protein OmpA-like peptidoglycan-associated protein